MSKSVQFTFTDLSGQEVDLISTALGQRTWLEVNALMIKLQIQVKAQQDAAQMAKKTAEPSPPQ